jgi:N-acetylmuramoyl-L-alanine amidase
MQTFLAIAATAALAAATVTTASLPASAEPSRANTSEAETACLAEAVYFEARGESARSRAAVAHVVVNRAESDEFPDTICGVVRQGCQFSYNCDGLPETLASPESRANAFETAEAVLEGAADDPTEGALYFHGDAATPSWATSFDRTSSVGGHHFYR